MPRGEHLKNYKGPRGKRASKDEMDGFSIGNMVEFEWEGVQAFGKVIDFKRKDGKLRAEVSVKAVLEDDEEWTRYFDYYDFKYVLPRDLTRAPKGVLEERTKRRVRREISNEP